VRLRAGKGGGKPERDALVEQLKTGLDDSRQRLLAVPAPEGGIAEQMQQPPASQPPVRNSEPDHTPDEWERALRAWLASRPG
jgi:hypothetical protein